MSKIIKNICVIVCVCLTLGLVACGGNNAQGTVKYNFSVNVNEVSLELGDKFQIFATYGDEDLTYTSLDGSVATVSETGEISAVGKGTTFIRIDAEKEFTNVKVVVLEPEYTIELKGEESDFYLLVNAPKIIEITLKKDGELVNEKLTFSCTDANLKVVELTNTSASVCASAVGVYQVKVAHASGETLTVTVEVK